MKYKREPGKIRIITNPPSVSTLEKSASGHPVRTVTAMRILQVTCTLDQSESNNHDLQGGTYGPLPYEINCITALAPCGAHR